jgi:hypothetical protein
MGFLMPKMPAMPAPPIAPAEPPAYDDKEKAAEVKRKLDAIERNRMGRESTILTTYQGLDNQDLTTDKKTLLGA